MNKSFIRVITYIVLVVGLNFIGLAYFTTEMLRDGWNTTSQIYIAAGFVVSFILLAILIYFLLRRMLAPLSEVIDLIKDLSQGHYWRRIHPHHDDGEVYDLIVHTNQLAQHLQQSVENQHTDQERLQALIRHMASGLLYVDHKGRIALTNQTLLEMLQWSADYKRTIYHQAPLPLDIIVAIQEAFMEEKESKKQITLKQGLKRLEISLLIAPVKDREGKLKGIVLVFHDITDLKHLEKMRQDFVANVSHELKTPLTSIKGFTETLLDGALYSEKNLLHFLGIIKNEAERLDRLINDLLELSNLEQKALTLHWAEVDLVNLVEETLILLSSRAAEKKIELCFPEKQKGIIVWADADRIRQIVLNLVSNAIQYTGEQGRVEISISSWKDKGYMLCVADTGVGITESERARIFERFYRVDKARSRASGGTGLGLAIVKHIVELHGGDISVQSEEGKGSTFCVSLPSKANK